MEESIESILPRQIKSPEIKDLLENFSNGIEQVVNFGTHILNWELKSAKGGDENIPIAMMLRHIIELTDSISILVRKSSIDPCKPILRSILETVFGLEYLLEENTKERAFGFLVWHYYNDLKLYKKFSPDEDTYKDLEKKLEKDKSFQGDNILPKRKDIKEKIKIIETVLNLPIYQNAVKEYNRLISTGNSNPKWYQFYSNIKNLYALANHINRQGLYEILYRSWSGPTHGTDIIHGKLSQSIDGSAEVVQIRFVKDAQIVTQLACTLSFITYKIITDKRLPNRKRDYAKWYGTIRDFYIQITKEQFISI